MKITLFRAFPDPYRFSMERYTQALLKNLRPLAREDEFRGFLPKHLWLTPRPARYFSQYLLYQFQARGAQGDVNHMIDHAYGHLLLTLDPARTVVTFHDAIGWDRRSIVRRYSLCGIQRAAFVICASESTRRDFLGLCRYPSERTAVIYQGVAESFFHQPEGDPRQHLGLPPGRYILHVGHNRFYKNIPGLFRVFSLLTRSLGQDVKLLKVGEAFTANQERLARELGIQDRIVHLGMVSEERLPEVYRCAELLFFPSLNEGFGLPVLEAMASGIPVVTSHQGALPEIVADAGILANPDDEMKMAKEVARILENPSLRAQLSQAGIQQAHGFTWGKTAQQTLEVYRKIHQARVER